MKIFMTGSSGFIGQHLSERLCGNELHFLACDLRDHLSVVSQVRSINPDIIIHLAARTEVEQSFYEQNVFSDVNYVGTVNLIEAAKHVPNLKNFIFASTGAADGCASAYGISKRAAEDVVREYCTTHRPTPYTIFRFYNVIGSTVVAPTNPDGLMYNLMKARDTGYFTIFGNDYNTEDGTCVRDYVHVNEICDALRSAIEKPSNQIECLGHGIGYTVAEIVELFKKVNNIKNIDLLIKVGPRRKGDLETSVLANVSPYMKELYSLEELVKI